MNISITEHSGLPIAIIRSNKVLITDVQSALDLIATVGYETGSHRIAIDKASIAEAFFDLKSRLAGDILQKFIIYDTKIAIFGDFSMYTSQSLKDFIYECNKGKDIFFVADEEQAIERLSAYAS